jgi:hypothetical protein
MSTEPREKRSSFADLAKLAQMTPPPSAPVTSVTPSEREENSGVINLAALQASEEQAHAAAVAASALATPATAAPSASAAPPLSARESFGPRAASGTTRALSWLALAGIAAAAAAAGGAFVAKRVTHPATETLVVSANAPAPGHASDAPHARALAQNATQGDSVVDPSNLPRVGKVAQPVHGSAPVAAPPNKGGFAHPAPVAANDKPEAPAAAPVAEAPAGGGAGGKNLDTLMQEAVGSPKEEPATVQPTIAAGPEPASGSVPLRPSLGAINGALGTVMPTARACLDEDAPVSRASVTFNSDGTVGNVSVSGWAAGKPAEQCIRAALGKARVPPFAQPTYTAPATIRSN